ncbi:MAG: hypothetical protein R3C68_03245 [Myxococcota bacterium]
MVKYLRHHFAILRGKSSVLREKEAPDAFNLSPQKLTDLTNGFDALKKKIALIDELLGAATESMTSDEDRNAEKILDTYMLSVHENSSATPNIPTQKALTSPSSQSPRK